MFNGRIKSVGPRYCPSIEDKIDRLRIGETSMFIEPEGWDTVEVCKWFQHLVARRCTV
jgi:tRNA uridine 5-carboxymethylaminomethyl modification enzyme